MTETPEEIKERIHSEEMAKGSDPRVAEGRAKAAEARAREGLPIDPEEAWRAKLEREGGGGAAEAPADYEAEPEASEAEVAESQAEAETAESQAETDTQAEPSAEEAAPSEEPAASQAEAATAAEPVAIPGVETDAPPTVVAPTVAAAAVEEPDGPPPEVGERVEVVDEASSVVAGITVRDARLPVWMVAVMAAILIWAATYLVVFSFSDPSPCEVAVDQTFQCVPEEETSE